MSSNAKVTVGENEPIERALNRFKRLVEKAGVKKEVKQRRYYEKPSETKRRELRKQERNRRKTDKKYQEKRRPVYYISPPTPKPSES